MREPITLYQGQVLDGWQRYTMANVAGVPCPEEQLPEGEDPVAFVISKHTRRNMRPGQRAACVAACFGWRDRGRPAADEEPPWDEDEPDNSVPGTDFPGEPDPPPLQPATTQEIADRAGVSTRTVEDVKAGERGGYGEAMRAGDMSPKEAARRTRAEEQGADPEERPPTPSQVKQTELEAAWAALAERDDRIGELEQTIRYYRDQARPDEAAKEQVLTGQFALVRSLKAKINELTAKLSEATRSRGAMQAKLRTMARELAEAKGEGSDT